MYNPSSYNTGKGIFQIVNVADITSELASNYSWNATEISGFITEVQQFGHIIAGYRVMNGEEKFIYNGISLTPHTMALVLTTQVHAISSGAIEVYIDDELIDTGWIPEMRGQIVNIRTFIPPKYVRDGATIRIIPNIPNGYYAPSCHIFEPWGEIAPEGLFLDTQVPEFIATYQNESFGLIDRKKQNSNFSLYKLDYEENILELYLFFFNKDNGNSGDYRFFAHLYDDPNQPPVTQWDGYYANALVGNWLPGSVQDFIHLNIENVPNGTYKLAIGFYNPQNPQDRLIPESDVYEVSPDGRLWLGEITIDND